MGNTFTHWSACTQTFLYIWLILLSANGCKYKYDELYLCQYLRTNEQLIFVFQAKSRMKLNFLDQLAKFWELQVSSYFLIHICFLYVYIQKVIKLLTLYPLPLFSQNHILSIPTNLFFFFMTFSFYISYYFCWKMFSTMLYEQ